MKSSGVLYLMEPAGVLDLILLTGVLDLISSFNFFLRNLKGDISSIVYWSSVILGLSNGSHLPLKSCYFPMKKATPENK